MEGLTEGRIVHFVLREKTWEGYPHRAAVVAKVWRDQDGKPPANGCVNLRVFLDGTNDRPNESDWATSVLFDPDGAPGTWHWIEKA